MKKILFISPTLRSGGAERQMVTIACLLSTEGYKVEFYTYQGEKDDFYSDILNSNSITIHYNPQNNWIKRIYEVRTFIRKGDYDAVISFLEVPNFLNNIAAIGGKKWKVITGERSAQPKTFSSLRGKVFCYFQKYSDNIVCNSFNAKKRWEIERPIYKKKLDVIYNTVTMPQINSVYIPRKNGKTNIVVAASLYSLKNPIGLINALSLMTQEELNKIHIDWYGQLNVAFDGNNNLGVEVPNLIKERQLDDVITISPPSKNIHNIMNEADAVALFSKIEGLPNTICEAMTLGKPIIMTRVSDFETLITPSNGFLCDWNNPISIKQSIIALTNCNFSQLAEMGRESRRIANGIFQSENVIKKWRSLID